MNTTCALTILLLLVAILPLLASEAPDGGVEITDLGPGIVSYHVSSSHLAGDTHWVTSRRVAPGLLAAYDVVLKKLVVNQQVSVDGKPETASSVVEIDGEIYFIAGSETSRASIAHYDRKTAKMSTVADLSPVRVVWEVDVAPDGKLYIASSRQTNGRLFEFDPKTRKVRDMGPMETQPRQDARCVAATSDKVYVGMGYNAVDLWAVDRATGEKTSILPPELKDQNWIYSLDATEDWIAVGTSGRPSKFAVINRHDYSDYRIREHGGGTVMSIKVDGTVVYLGTGTRVWRYDIEADKLVQFATMPASRGLFVREGMLHGGGGSGDIAAVRITGEHTELPAPSEWRVRLAEAGVEKTPEWPQSIAAGSGKAFVGGRALGVLDLETGEREQIRSPGEVKSMAVVGDSLYMGMYTSGQLACLDIPTGKITAVAKAPDGQLRPRIVHHDAVNNRVLMGTQADEQRGGSLLIFDPKTGNAVSAVNPFADVAVATITSLDGVAYLGAQRDDGPVAAWDPVKNERLWQITPAPGDWAMGLAALGKRLYGFSSQGTFFVIDLETRAVIHSEKLFGQGGRLLAHDGMIYGVNADVLFKVDPQTLKHRVVVDKLDAQLFGWPSLAVDPQGALYVFRGTHVLRVKDRN